MTTHYSYQLFKVRQAEELRNAQQRQLSQQAQSAAATVYHVALGQVPRRLVAVGQRLQTEPLPMPSEA